jgi:hypothetical protein
MKSLALVLFTASLSLSTVSVRADDPPAKAPTPPAAPAPAKPGDAPKPGEGGRQGGGERQQSEFRGLGGAMKAMETGMKEISATIDDASKKETTLRSIAYMQRACEFSKRSKSKDIKGSAGPDGAAVLVAYRKSQAQMLKMLCELELQVIDGKTDEAKATLKKIGEHAEAGHKQFVEEKHEGNEREEGGKGKEKGAGEKGGDKK